MSAKPAEADDSDLLPDLARWIHEEHGSAAPNYRLIWEAVVSGYIPAYRRGRTWRVLKSDRPAVAAYFGLTAEPAPPPPPSSSRKPHAA